MANVFLEKYSTPFESVPFEQIHFEDYEEAIMEGMKREDEDLERMLNNPEEPTFENTIDTDDDKTLSRVTSTFFNLLSANTSDELDELAQKMSPLLTEHGNNIMLNERFFERVKKLKENHRPLTTEEQMLLDNLYEAFERNGATLSKEDKETFRKLDQQLSMLTLQFSQNELKDTNFFTLHITDTDKLKGLPQTALDAASMAAQENGKEGWVFTLHAPSFTPFMTYCEDRELRKQMFMAKNTLCTHDNEYNNEEIVRQIVNLRRRKAQLLGYRNWAEFALKRRMAENTDNVGNLLNKLLDAYLPAAQKEVAEIEALARKKEGDDFQLMPWDFAFYSHQLKMECYNIDAEMLRPYFELSQVIKGVFGLATRLYGITFHKRSDIQVYHKDVEAWEVKDENGEFLAILYTDFHPRKSKQSGAWMTTYKEQYMEKCKGGAMHDSRPLVSVTMNFTKPTENTPALLTLDEVETFLHEFGHALHGMFSKVRFESLSCTNVYWDFVELPSQFMENYAVEPEFLNTFARHYQTGEPIPQELIDRIRKSRNFNVAYACIRQLSFGLLDMAYYTLEDDFEGNVEEFERKAMERTRLLPSVPGTCISVQFGHIMSGGYSAGYYSYKWAEVLEADAFSIFQKEGIFNRETASRFRNEILSKGGTEPPMTLYRRFRGGEPTIDALLKRNGII